MLLFNFETRLKIKNEAKATFTEEVPNEGALEPVIDVMWDMQHKAWFIIIWGHHKFAPYNPETDYNVETQKRTIIIDYFDVIETGEDIEFSYKGEYSYRG